MISMESYILRALTNYAMATKKVESRIIGRSYEEDTYTGGYCSTCQYTEHVVILYYEDLDADEYTDERYGSVTFYETLSELISIVDSYRESES